MKNNIKIYQKSISPKDAEIFLKNNKGNRKLSDKQVNYYVNQMRSGEWLLTGDPIKLSKSKRVLDGQHRLQAIIKYGKPVEMFIAENLDEGIFPVLDTGKVRSAGDVLSTKGFKYSSNLAGAARAIILYDKGSYGQAKERVISKATNTAILKFVEENPEIHEVIAYTFSVYDRFRFMNLSALTMLYWTLSKKNQSKCDQFFEQFATGINLSADSPIRILREKLIKDSANKLKLTVRDKAALFILAWNAYLKNKQITSLSLGRNYDFPKPL